MTEAQRLCDEPWTGLFSVNTNGDVVFCPCYARVKIGSIESAGVRELWNGDLLAGIRESFRRGEFPACCRDQLCPPVTQAERARRGSGVSVVAGDPATGGAGSRPGCR